MKLVKGVWLPDDEEEMLQFLRAEQLDGVGLYQYGKLTEALSFVKQRRTAVDVGGHCGLWSMHLAKKFERVFAFEPIERHRECFRLNAPNAELLPYALGDKNGTVKLAKGEKSTGDTHISSDGEYTAEIRRLDEFNIQNVDFIKMDCEGYELFVCRGAEETIKRCRPVTIVEQKPRKGRTYGIGDTEAVKWLRDVCKYRLRKVISGDYILTP